MIFLFLLKFTVFCSFTFSPYEVSRKNTLPSTEQEFKNILQEQQPFIFDTSSNSWDSKELCFNSLKKKFGDENITVKHHYNDAFIEAVNTQTTLKQFIENLATSPETAGYLVSVYRPDALYGEKGVKLLDQNFLKNHPELLHSLPFCNQQILFVGPKGTSSKFHQHEAVFATVIEGEKSFYLVSPEYRDQLYIQEGSEGSIESSPIDPTNPNLALFPLFRNVPIFKTSLKPGEVLYIPQGWYHFVKTDKNSVSLAAFFEI